MTEACHDIAHLAHVEMLTDRFDASLDFFTRVYGLKLSALDGDSAYLRGHSATRSAASTMPQARRP